MSVFPCHRRRRYAEHAFYESSRRKSSRYFAAKNDESVLHFRSSTMVDHYVVWRYELDEPAKGIAVTIDGGTLKLPRTGNGGGLSIRVYPGDARPVGFGKPDGALKDVVSISAQEARASHGRIEVNKYIAFPEPLKAFSVALKMRDAWFRGSSPPRRRVRPCRLG